MQKKRVVRFNSRNGSLYRRNFTLIELLITIAVIAILATMLASGMTVEEAVRTANRAAGVVVGKLGTATVSYEELF